MQSLAKPSEARLCRAKRGRRRRRPAPKAAGAEGAPELREGFKQKLEAYIIEAFKHVAYILPGSAGKRVCTNLMFC